MKMSKKRPVRQDIGDSCYPSEVKKTRYNPISESDSHKGELQGTPHTVVSSRKRPLHRDDLQAADRQRGTTSEDASNATLQGHGRSGTDKGISLDSPASRSRGVVSAEGAVLPIGLPVHWYNSEGREEDQVALHGCSSDRSPVVEGSCSTVELCRTFKARLNWDDPSHDSCAVPQNSEGIGVGLTGVSSVPLGLQQGREEAGATKCSFIGRNTSPSTTEVVHPDLPVNLPQDPSSSSRCCCPETAMCGCRHGHFPSDHLLSSVDKKKVATLYHYKVVLSPPTNFDGPITSTLFQDGKSFAFDGFSLWSAVVLDHVASCTFVRFGHQHTASLVREAALEGQPPRVEEMLLLQEYLFVELLELYDWVKALQPVSGALFFVPRFANVAPSCGGDVKHILTVRDVLQCLLELRAPLAVDGRRGGSSSRKTYSELLVTFPGKQPRCLRVDRLTPRGKSACSAPSLVHFCTRRAEDSFVGSEEYQSKLKQYIKLLGDKINGVMKKKEYFRLFEFKHRLRELRNQNSLKRDAVMEINCGDCLSTGLRADVMRQALVMPMVAHHVRFHLSLPILEETLQYTFHDKTLLQMALTHPSFTLKYGTKPSHIRNSLTNCAVKRPEVAFCLTNKTARKEGLSHSVMPFNNERLEFLGDAVIEYLCSLHLFQMFPTHRDGQLTSYRAALVQNKHLHQVAMDLKLQDYLMFSHEPEFSMEGVFNHELSNCFEALIGAIFLDSSLEECDHVLSQAFFNKDGADVLSAWTRFAPHPLQRENPSGDRFMIAESEVLQNLTSLENAIGLEFDHIRLLAKAFTHPSVEHNSLTRGHNQRLEFLGDAVLQFVVSWFLYSSFPDHHEGKLTMMRASLVNNTSLAAVASDLGLQQYVLIDKKQDVPVNVKLLADLTESLLAAILLDKGVAFVGKFCEVCLFPRLPQTTQEGGVAMDVKTTLNRRLGLELRKHGLSWEPPHYSVVERKGPPHNPVFTVTVSVRGHVMAHGEGPSIRSADMEAAKSALSKLPGIVKFLTKVRKKFS